jgi:hypothetical protein
VTETSSRAGLAPRVCPTCGASYQPHNKNQVACGRKCRESIPRNRERIRAYHASPENRERKNAARRVSAGPQRVEANRRNNLRRYGITPERFDEMSAEQGGTCALCGGTPRPDGVKAASRLHVDHDHETGAVRRLLCNGCNRGLGYLQDSPELLRMAADYVERHRATSEP